MIVTTASQPPPSRSYGQSSQHILISPAQPRPTREMGNAYVFSLQPTFTQGLILGQFSILFLLVLILKYLFFDTVADHAYRASSYQPKVDRDEDEDAAIFAERLAAGLDKGGKAEGGGLESADWLNGVLRQVRR